TTHAGRLSASTEARWHGASPGPPGVIGESHRADTAPEDESADHGQRAGQRQTRPRTVRPGVGARGVIAPPEYSCAHAEHLGSNCGCIGCFVRKIEPPCRIYDGDAEQRVAGRALFM